MRKNTFKFDQQYTYQIKVPGDILADASGWENVVFACLEVEFNTEICTSLICYFDQSGMHGFLRSLYAKGMPVILVRCVDHV